MRRMILIAPLLALAACGTTTVVQLPAPVPTQATKVCPPVCSNTGWTIVPPKAPAKARHKAHKAPAIVAQGQPVIDRAVLQDPRDVAVKAPPKPKTKPAPVAPKMTDDEWCRSTGQGDHDVIIRYSHGVPVHTCQ